MFGITSINYHEIVQLQNWFFMNFSFYNGFYYLQQNFTLHGIWHFAKKIIIFHMKTPFLPNVPLF